ncbi:MAG: cytochrome c-type biogenesis protein CcmH [Acidimicrobiia bacterium]|nr:cytochrome c-type biogenesis protein CcmH [Acidimicrobiia bacterium]
MERTRRAAGRGRLIGWALLGAVVVALLTVGIVRDRGAESSQDRADDVARRIACPVCDGESVFESRNNASEAIRAAIDERVTAGRQSDDQIISYIESRFGGQLLLVPRATGIDAVVWAVPAGALVVALAALALTFRRWSAQPRAAPTESDRDLVAAAMDDP